MKQHALLKKAVLALFAGSTGLFAGEPAPMLAPPSDCSGCTNPGFYVEGSLLYMNSYRSDTNYDGDWELGYRGSVGFETQSGLFAELTGFYYSGDYGNGTPGFSGEADFYTVDLMIGDTVHCGELCVAIAGGLRYGGFEDARKFAGGPQDSFEFDGWGPVIEIAAERSLTEQFSLYAELRQSILFGESDTTGQRGPNQSSDTIAAITEIGAGLQFNFAMGPVQNAFVRAGFEGQYWHIDGGDSGLLGGVLSVGATF